MKILIVDNGSTYLDDLIRLVQKKATEISVIKFDHLGLADSKEYDLIILSGGHGLPVKNHEREYKKEIDLIKNCQTPLLGICLGFELIAVSFGSSLKLLDEKEHTQIKINATNDDPLFHKVKRMIEFESHRWKIDRLGDDLTSLAESQDGIEIIKHKTKNIYGFQFHPEESEKGCTRTLFANLLKIAESGKIECTK